MAPAGSLRFTSRNHARFDLARFLLAKHFACQTSEASSMPSRTWHESCLRSRNHATRTQQDPCQRPGTLHAGEERAWSAVCEERAGRAKLRRQRARPLAWFLLCSCGMVPASQAAFVPSPTWHGRCFTCLACEMLRKQEACQVESGMVPAGEAKRTSSSHAKWLEFICLFAIICLVGT